MKINIISFTSKGIKLSLELKKFLTNHEIDIFSKSSECKKNSEYKNINYVESDLYSWSEKSFKDVQGIIFIGACGIAVRAIAPFVKDKLKDPAVIVIDEKGNFIIPILSGHIGGANELAEEIGLKINALPIITTATDINNIFAVDIFAKKNDLAIANKDGIAKVSSSLLEGKEVSVLISPFENERAVLQLCPRKYFLGIGCKKGKTIEEIEHAVLDVLKNNNIKIQALKAIASINEKKYEQGIIDFAKKYNIDFITFSAGELMSIDGDFESSEFVLNIMGTDNVCERAAVRASGENGTLICKKTAINGVTVALAKK